MLDNKFNNLLKRGGIASSQHLPRRSRMHGPAKVSYLEFPLRPQQEILRFDITMNDTLGMTVDESFGQLIHILGTPVISIIHFYFLGRFGQI